MAGTWARREKRLAIMRRGEILRGNHGQIRRARGMLRCGRARVQSERAWWEGSMFQVTSPSVERAVAAADALLAGGRIVDAGNGYRAVLCEWPEHVGALRGFAVCADSVGNWGLAE